MAKDRPMPMRNTTAGSRFLRPPAAPRTTSATKTLAPSWLVTPDRVQAKIRIRIAGTMALKPSTRAPVNSSKVTTFRGRYHTAAKIRVRNAPSTRPTEASEALKASMRFK